MKNLSSIISGLKLILKYSAYILVLVDIVNFAIEKIETLNTSDSKSLK